MPHPSTSLGQSILFWCVCVCALTMSATWFAARAWFRAWLVRELKANNAHAERRAAEARGLADTLAQRSTELQAKLRAFESRRMVGPVELEAMIVRRWLRNAGEHANPSPQKAVSSAAAVALAFVGADHLRARIEPLTAMAKAMQARQNEGIDVGAQLTQPEAQGSQQWLQILSELDALLAPDAAPGLLNEWLWGQHSGGEYWNARALRMAAGEVLTQGHMAALEIARKRANGSADLGPPTVPPV